MTSRLEINWKLDGLVNEQRYYRSETPIDLNNLPLPKTILAGDVRSHIDMDGVLGQKYYVRISSVKNSIEKVSNEKQVLFGKEWTPDLSSAKIYLLADDVTNDIVSSWTCRKTGVIFTQSNPSYRPVLGSINGQKAVYFDGSPKMLESNNSLVTSILNNKSDAWYLVVTKKDNSLAIGGGSLLLNFTLGTSAGGRLNILAGDSAANVNKYNFGGRRLDSDVNSSLLTSNYNSNTGNADIVTGKVKYTAPKFQLFVNGAFDSESTPAFGAGNTSTTNSQYVRISATTNYAAKGWVACIIAGNTELTDVERQKLEGWVAHKYGLTSNLPVDHPYKTLIPTT